MEMKKQFKPFRDTYKIITMTMCLGMIYPNPKKEMMRMIGIPILLVTVVPLAAMMLIDMYFCWMRGDIVNIIRHSTVLGPFLGGFFKMILIFFKRKEAQKIIDEMDRDYESYNSMSEEYRELTAKGIRNSQVYSERCWVVVVITCVMTFPAMAILQTTYNCAFVSEPVKYMIHDLNIPFCDPEIRFNSPQFEITFVYMFYASILYVINFIGYDGFFGLSINHACMKMDLYCKALEDAFRDGVDVFDRIVNVIHEQNRMFEFVDLIQDVHNIWLGIIFLATMIQICTCLYHITEEFIMDVSGLTTNLICIGRTSTFHPLTRFFRGYGFDLRYMVFVMGSVIHIYLPCRYAAKLKAMSVETSTQIYCCGWERINDQSIRKMIMFMIARAQRPIEITAFNMMAFDMDLFVSILQTSYSMYTLLSS